MLIVLGVMVGLYRYKVAIKFKADLLFQGLTSTRLSIQDVMIVPLLAWPRFMSKNYGLEVFEGGCSEVPGLKTVFRRVRFMRSKILLFVDVSLSEQAPAYGAFATTLGDVIARFQRLKGKNVIHQWAGTRSASLRRCCDQEWNTSV